MDYNLNESIKELKSFLNQTRLEKNNFNVDTLANEADLLWDASRFFAALIYNSEPFGWYKTYEQFQEFKTEYELSTGIKIDDKKLFEKFWLRNVLGFIEVSGGISSLCYRFKEIKDYQNELLFWLEFQKAHSGEKGREIEKSLVDIAIAEYETSNAVSLNSEGIYFSRWVSIKDNKVEYSNMEVYFKHFVDYWDDFAFLCEFKQSRNEDENKKLLVKKTDFDKLHQSFQMLYPQIPTIEEFKEQKLVIEEDEFYGLNFYNTEPKYWAVLKDKIGGFLWELMIKDHNYTDDKQRLKDWLAKLMYWSRWTDPFLYVTQKSITRFLDTAFELVINEPDLLGTENEFAKVCLDGKMSMDSLLTYERAISSKEFTLNSADVYELLASFYQWEKRATTTYLHGQDSRNMLAYLIKMLVNYDSENSYNEPTESALKTIANFRRVISLLHAGIKKPFLIWEVTSFILLDRLEIIPYVISEAGIETLSFIFLDSINFLAIQKAELNLVLWEKSTRLFLQSLSRDESPETAKKIFQIYRSLNKNKYEIPYNRSNWKQETEKRENHEKKESLVLGLIEDSRLHQYMAQKQDSDYFIPTIYSKLATVIIEYSSKPFYRNGTVQFPIMQWDAITWMLKVSTFWKFHDQISQIEESRDRLTEEFLRRYLESIEVNEVNKYNYFEEKEEIGLPIWSEKIERLYYIDWIYPIYFLNKKGLLNQFLSPRINIENTSDLYHEKNRFSADKLRTHLGVLLQILRKLILPVLPYGFERDELKSIKGKVELQIIDYLKNHLKDEPKEGKIDLFDYNKEWQFQSTDNEALFPQIARAINWFSDKDIIISAISGSRDISKLLTILNLVKSEGIKIKLLKEIEKLDILDYLEKYNWIPEVQYTITNLTSHPELLPQIEQAISFWKQHVIPKNDNPDYKMVLYKAELLVAYFKKSEEQIDRVIEPQRNYHSPNELNHNDYKQFYKGLLFIQTDPRKAHLIFDSLVLRYPSYPSFALNRMVSKINLAQAEDNLQLYREALEEWNDTENKIDADTVVFLEPELSENIMTVLNKISDYDQLELRYKTLDLPNRMRPTVLDIMVQSLLDQKKVSEALKLTSAAKTYHQFSDIRDIQFIVDLENKINQIDNLDELKGHYFRIFSSEPRKLIKIFPENLNGKTDLNEFLAKEITLAADKLLEKIVSISEIENEDKYNDLMELVLDARINPWGWEVGAQSRGAFPGTGKKQPGERDLPIMNQFKRPLLVCEAFIYRSASKAKSHLNKVFNYYHKRDSFAILVYDLSKTIVEFENNWKEYKMNIVPATKFPVGYEIEGTLEDVSKDFDFDKSGIKICTSKHRSGMILYHIFVNINYKLS